MTDAVKMAIEALTDIRTSIECAAGCEEGIDPMAAVSEIMSAYGTAMASAYSRAADMLNILTALEQAGEPVDVSLLDRAELAWQRFFYPAADCFTDPAADKLPAIDLEVADCLRLVLAAVGRLVVTPEADVPAPLPTIDAGEQCAIGGKCGMGALLDAIHADLDSLGAPRKSPDGNLTYGRYHRIQSVAAATAAKGVRDPLRDIVFRYIDRMNDVAPECGDPADRILGEFARDVNAVLKAERAALSEAREAGDGR